MADTLKIDGLDINDGPSFEYISKDLGVAKKRSQVQPYLQATGGKAIAGTQYYDTVVHKFFIRIKGASLSTLQANVSILQKKLDKENTVLEFAQDGASASSFADVLYCEYPGLDYNYVHAAQGFLEAEIIFVCQPFWYGTEQTIDLQTFTSTPAKLTMGTILGDVEAPAYLEITGQGTDTFGGNINIGSRAKPMNNTQFSPIMDFSGSVLTGCYGGEYKGFTPTNGAWDKLTATLTTNINGIAMLSATAGVLVGDGGMIYSTADGWVNITSRTSGTSQNLNAVVWAGGTTYYACGNGGVILKSTDSGGTWSTQTSGTTVNLLALSFISTTAGWVSGDVTIRKTTNGSTWASAGTAPTSKPITGITFVDANTGWCIDLKTGSDIFKSTNGGATWSAYVARFGGDSTATAIDAYDSTHVIAVATRSYSNHVYCSTNGTAWTQVAAVDGFRAIAMVSTTTGWAVGQNGIIYKTTDSGVTWTAQTSGTGAQLNCLSIVDSSNVHAAGAGFNIVKTTDGGTAWTQPYVASGWTLSSASDYEGRYRVWVRCSSAQTTPANLQLRASSAWAGGTVVANDAVNLAAGATIQWVDLGVIQVPCTPLSSKLLATAIPIIVLEVKASEASKSFKLDVAYLEPVDGSNLSTSATLTSANTLSIDTEEETVNQGPVNVTWVGRGPSVRPGSDNNLTIGETAAGDALGANGCTVLVKYKPRYLSPVA